MNFIKAIQHATIGKRIRRRAWPMKDAILSLYENNLIWRQRRNAAGDMFIMHPCKLCGPDLTLDLQPEDLQANDWEALEY